MLLEKRDAVLAGLGSKVHDLSKSGRVAEEDQAQQSHEEFVSLRLNGLEYLQLRQVQEALDRLQTGDFGTCVRCDQPIAEKRLQALPWAKFCVKCQELMSEEQPEEYRVERER
ncbi:MAG: TraR/DksA C4-type zinc finger protein [Bryobacteraceae bacterium]